MASIRYILLAVLFVGVWACQPDIAPAPLQNSLNRVPDHFPEPIYNYGETPYSPDIFQLGRKLFYDPILSADSTVSCGSCHIQSSAFADQAHDIPHGIDGRFGTRNSPAIFNTRWMKNFMWDGGVLHIEFLSLAPITNPVEMDETLESVLEKLNRNEAYKQEFKQAFQTETIQSKEMLVALAQFMSGLISDNSKYDQVLLGKASFTAAEQSGMSIFNENCASCHTGVLFTSGEFTSNGLDKVSADAGRYNITFNPSDSGTFKIPSLRNISLTSPYMHDGRLATLEDVIDHYRFHIQPSKNLGTSLQQGITLTDQEADNLLQFLHTLTDYSFTEDPRFSDPN